VYYGATVSLSKGERFGIWVGILVTILVFLLDPKDPLWRVLACLFLFIFGVLLVSDSDWVKQRSGNLSLFVDAGLPERISTPRLVSATLVIGVAVCALAVITWPAKEVPLRPFSVVAGVQPVTSTDPSSTVVGIPDSPKKATPSVDVPKGSPPTKHVPPAKPKPVPESKVYPVIVVSRTQVTTNPDTHKIDIVVTLGNLTSEKANVHIVSDMTWNGEVMPGTIDTRQVAFGPSPFLFEMRFGTTPFGIGVSQFESGTAKIAVVINASYPDQGGTTTYKYEGDIVPGATSLNDVATEWVSEPAKQ
jgi:hypothetical protein